MSDELTKLTGHSTAYEMNDTLTPEKLAAWKASLQIHLGFDPVERYCEMAAKRLAQEVLAL